MTVGGIAIFTLAAPAAYLLWQEHRLRHTVAETRSTA